MELLKKHKIKLIIIFAIILVIFFCIVLIKINPISIVKNITENIDEEKISYEIYGVQDGDIKILVKFSDNENGIDTIFCPNGKKIKCNNKKNIALDYEIVDYEKGTTKEILFKIINSNNEEFEEKVVINDEIINNIIKVDIDIDHLYVYFDIAYAEGTTEKSYRIKDVSEKYSNYSGQIKINPLNVSSILETKKIEIDIKQKHKTGNIIEITKEINLEDYLEDYTRDEGLVKKVAQISSSGYQEIEVSAKTNSILNSENVKYKIHSIVHEGDLVLDGITNVEGATLENNIYEFGDSATDVATASTYAQNMVVLKVNGNLIINEGVTLTACKSASGYGGPKGMMVYCTGTITNNGTISMTARGAKAPGQNVFLWRNKDESYEYIPAVGAAGGVRPTTRTIYNDGGNCSNGNPGANGQVRQTGGGGSGSIRNYSVRMYAGSGGAGTSYSGGSGGGAAATDWGDTRTAGSGSSEGGAGGHGAQGGAATGNSGGYTNGWGQACGGGQGNTPGNNVWSHANASVPKQETGTGGLLVIYCETLNNINNISADGVIARYTTVSSWNGRQNGGHNLSGGSSGGGSVNIFSVNIENRGNITAVGGTSQWKGMSWAGGAGGNGSISVGTIVTGTYESVYKNY